MTRYISILGHIILLLCVFITVLIIFFIFWYYNVPLYDEDIIISFIILILVYIIGHYTLLTIKGRNNIQLVDRKLLNLMAYLNIGYIIFVIILPLLFGYRSYRENNREIKEASELRTFNEVNLYGDKVNVQAKYIDKEMKYKVTVIFYKPQKINNKIYTIIFMDKDGFEIFKKEIEEYTYISRDGNLKNGLYAEKIKTYHPDFSLKDYLSIKKIDVVVKEK